MEGAACAIEPGGRYAVACIRKLLVREWLRASYLSTVDVSTSSNNLAHIEFASVEIILILSLVM